MSYFSRKANLYAKIIAWLQIIGGIFGLLLIASLMISTSEINGAVLLILIIGLALYAFSIHCGVKLLNPSTRNYGFLISFVNQGLQLLQFCIAGWGFSYASGINLSIGIRTGIRFAAQLSAFNMSIRTDDHAYFMINIFAIIVFIVLLKIYKTKEVEEAYFDEIVYADPEVTE